MRAVVQRVRSARVRVAGTVVGEIGPGLLALIGVGRDDGPADITWLASKIVELRVFDDEAGKMNRTLAEIGGRVLAVSQFTLYGDCRRGRRPSFDAAAPVEDGRIIFEEVVRTMRAAGAHVETGTYRAHMLVDLENDGPVTLLLDSKRQF
jgi:D-tyrosyl-tRNA(Tyr) deacylase